MNYLKKIINPLVNKIAVSYLDMVPVGWHKIELLVGWGERNRRNSQAQF